MRCFWTVGSREEDLIALVSMVVMELIGLLASGLYVEEERSHIFYS